MKKSFWVLLMLGVLLSCQKEKDIVKEEEPESTLSGVLVGNEGNFNWGNATLSYIDADKKKIYNSVYQQKNNKPLGDILQSIYIRDDDAFLVINNSAKIVQISLHDFKEEAIYTSMGSPRYMYIYNGTAFVSDLYGNCIHTFDIDSKPVETGRIRVNGWTEEMDAGNNLLYVAGVNANKVYVIDMDNKILCDSIETADAPFSVKIDKNGDLWVYCGDYQSENYVLEKIDTETKEIKTQIVLPNNAASYATKMAMNKEKTDIWFIYDGIKHIAITDTTYENFISSAYFRTPYGLGIDNAGNVYVADALDFTSEGKIYVFDNRRVLLTSYTAGVIPGSFAFYNLYE